MEIAERGFAAELGIEQQVMAHRAVEDGKPIQGLETAAQQFAVLGGLPLAEQKRFLLMTLEESSRPTPSSTNCSARGGGRHRGAGADAVGGIR